MGGDFGRGRALIAPELQEWIASRLRDEAAVLKEKRKGREERQLARGGVGPSKTSGSPAGGDAPAGGKKK